VGSPAVPRLLRTVRVALSGLLLITVPSQRASFAAFPWVVASCANIAVTSGKASTDVNNRVSSFFTMCPPPFQLCAAQNWMSVISVQHFVLSFFRDQLLELCHDLVPSRHHGLHFILGEITLSFCRQFVSIERLQFVEQLPFAAD